jgi:hypothetical protein
LSNRFAVAFGQARWEKGSGFELEAGVLVFEQIIAERENKIFQ